MTRRDTFLLILLAGIGWGCAFAIVGYAAFRGSSSIDLAAAIFGAFGTGAGVCVVGIRLAMLHGLPHQLSFGWRASPQAPASAKRAEPQAVSAFGR